MSSSMVNEIFERLLHFGNESDRQLFCQRLKTIWQEQGIYCQSYPTITNQNLDLYRLHSLVQERQGYLEITTNRGWKEISTILGFGDSGSAAYSVKRNYVRLGLLAYECRFDRLGLDPRSVIELSEMPHAVKKRKRTQTNSPSATTSRTGKERTNNNQTEKIIQSNPLENFSMPTDEKILRRSFTAEICRLSVEQMPLTNDLNQVGLIIRGGHLAESNKFIDTILVWLSESRTASLFNLKSYPVLFNVVFEEYVVCLSELFGNEFSKNPCENNFYLDCFLQSTSAKIDSNIFGPLSNVSRLERIFFGNHRYLLRNVLRRQNPSTPDERHHLLIKRSSCLTTILRNFSFIEENSYLANDQHVLDVLQRILLLFHEKIHRDEPIFESDHPLCCRSSCQYRHWIYLLDNTLVTLTNLSTSIDLKSWTSPSVRIRFVRTILHWICCLSPLATEIFIPMKSEEFLSSKKLAETIFVSIRQISLQIFAKLCTNENNVDFIFIDQNFEQLKIFADDLLSMVQRSTTNNVDLEYILSIISSLCKRSEQLTDYFVSKRTTIEFLLNYLSSYEHHQQEFLLATLHSCYSISSTNSISLPINHSNDMMIDSCIQLLVLFASSTNNNLLRLFEDRFVELSTSIYFEQKFLKDFAQILFLLKSD